MNSHVMFHAVAGFPTRRGCLELLKGMDAAGAEAIEIQVPFSDPIADGETIIRANDLALNNDMTTGRSLDLIEEAIKQGLKSDIFVMSYLQKVNHFGFDNFCERSAVIGVKGLIIPDLPYDSPEFKDIYKLTQKYGLQLVPVLSPGMPDSRLKAILLINEPLVYVTSRKGITGNSYSGTAQLKDLVTKIRHQSKAKIMIGFGISSIADVNDALNIADTAVVGSAIINKIQDSNIGEAINFARSLAGNISADQKGTVK